MSVLMAHDRVFKALSDRVHFFVGERVVRISDPSLDYRVEVVRDTDDGLGGATTIHEIRRTLASEHIYRCCFRKI